MYGVVACGGCGGCPVAVASRHGRSGPVGTAAACQLVGVRQRAGAGGRWLGYGPACFYAGGQRPAAGQVRLGVWDGVAAHLAVGGAAGVPRGRAGPHRGQRLAGAALSLPPFLLGPAILVAVIRWPPAAASGSQWPAWRSPAATRAGSLYRLGGVLAGGRAKLCRRRGPAW
jgi:hypothetical protein